MNIVTKKIKDLKSFLICNHVRVDVDKRVFFIYKLLKLLVRVEEESYKTIN